MARTKNLDLKTFTASISADHDKRIRELRFNHRVSGASVVSAALDLLFREKDDKKLSDIIKTLGYGIRRDMNA
jgi:hypothetical protein